VAVFSPSAPAQKLQSAGISLLAFAAGIFLLYYGRALCITLVISVILAFILDPFVALFMRMRMPRGVASFFVCTIALLIVYLLGLGAWIQLAGLREELPVYSQRINELVDSVAEKLERMEQEAYRLIVPKRFQNKERETPPQQPPEPKRRRRAEPPPQPAGPPPVQDVRVLQDRTPVAHYLFGYVSSLYYILLMVSFVPFLVYFMLSWRDHIRRSFLSLFEGANRIVAGRSWQSIADMARAYVVGNFILGVLLAIGSCLCFWSWHLPYWILVGVLSGFLSLVPYVGMPLAVVPPLLAALPVYSAVTPYLIIGATVAFLHLLALNLLYPAIVGSRVHLNPLAVTIALMFWGTIWGGIGLMLAIPLTAGAKAVFDNVEALQPYGRMLGDSL
jgi:predicted PurR-regulated permease PerM